MPALQPVQGFDRKVRSDGGQPRRQSLCRVVRSNGDLLLKKNIAGIEAGVNLHRGDPSDSFAARNRPLNGRSAAIFRQERGVQVDVAEQGEDRASTAE